MGSNYATGICSAFVVRIPRAVIAIWLLYSRRDLTRVNVYFRTRIITLILNVIVTILDTIIGCLVI